MAGLGRNLEVWAAILYIKYGEIKSGDRGVRGRKRKRGERHVNIATMEKIIGSVHASPTINIPAVQLCCTPSCAALRVIEGARAARAGGGSAALCGNEPTACAWVSAAHVAPHHPVTHRHKQFQLDARTRISVASLAFHHLFHHC
uniref:Uncharacterized protein n=1 Tax=Lotharella oceanica TaxID=641309 RepID=A0A7S2TKV6_9EUKA|mmetsp:Transcript_17330/g.32900  ORF Transcript_17330/g.32900 Transcript_17330/m.32900 type:complete len:145 (+) Transcript_17330:148-582(+)